nr:J197 [uncultured bacterium]
MPVSLVVRLLSQSNGPFALSRVNRSPLREIVFVRRWSRESG